MAKKRFVKFGFMTELPKSNSLTRREEVYTV